jgi:dual specificity MAP kinase phosphatase
MGKRESTWPVSLGKHPTLAGLTDRYAPPFQPPPYRGLSILYVGQQMINKLEEKPKRRSPLSDALQPLTSSEPSVTVDYAPAFDRPEPRERSDTMSTADSYYSCDTGNPISLLDWAFGPNPATLKNKPKNKRDADVKMHPTESKRLSPAAADDQESKGAKDEHKTWVPLFGGPPVYADDDSESLPELTSDSSESLDEEQAPNCILLNALHVQDIFDLPGTSRHYIGEPRFRPPRLPGAINLRNLNIQQIKYPSISDIILYAKGGVSDGLLKVAEMVAQAQGDMYQFRMDDYYRHVEDGSAAEGVGRPVKYGVWCIVGEKLQFLSGTHAHVQNHSTNSRHSARS